MVEISYTKKAEWDTAYGHKAYIFEIYDNDESLAEKGLGHLQKYLCGYIGFDPESVMCRYHPDELRSKFSKHHLYIKHLYPRKYLDVDNDKLYLAYEFLHNEDITNSSNPLANAILYIDNLSKAYKAVELEGCLDTIA